MSPGFAIALHHETVRDKVNYSPNLQAGGFADAVSKPRFQANGFTLSYNPDKHRHYFFSLHQRQMNSLRDAFSINQLNAGLSQRYQSVKAPWLSFGFGVEADFNHASELYKNSYTSYSDKLITEVRLVDPRDARLSISADWQLTLSDHIQATIAVKGGLSQTSQKEVLGSARLDNNCLYEFNASGQGGSLRQLDRCGDLVSYEQHYPSNQAINDRLGFSVADDLTYRDYFLGPQFSLGWRHRAWALSAGYAFRHYSRPALDKRMRDAGDAPISRSHSAYANASVFLFRYWQVAAGVKYQQAAFLDDVPFLYTALTHERYRGKGVLRYTFTLTRYFK